MITLGAHEILMLVPEARERWQAIYDAWLKTFGPGDFDWANTAANEATIAAYGPEAQRLHDAAVKRTLEGG